ERGKGYGRKAPMPVGNVQPREQDMADHLAVLLGDEFDHAVAGSHQSVHQAGLRRLTERMYRDFPYRFAVARLRRPDGNHAHATLSPRFILAPRRKSSAVAGLLPARCSSVTRTAPSPQAMPRRSSMISPGAPCPSVGSERSSRT